MTIRNVQRDLDRLSAWNRRTGALTTEYARRLAAVSPFAYDDTLKTPDRTELNNASVYGDREAYD